MAATAGAGGDYESWPTLSATDHTLSMTDSGGGQVYVHVGKKSKKGSELERAGLTGGMLYGVKVKGVAREVDATTVAPGTRFSLVPIPGADMMTGAQLDATSNALGITNFARPEDGAWSKTSSRDFVFATTASITGVTRLWNLQFDDASMSRLAALSGSTSPARSATAPSALPDRACWTTSPPPSPAGSSSRRTLAIRTTSPAFGAPRTAPRRSCRRSS